ncbi:hypothetical protein [Listeria booriae]|uniref:DUF3021 domain-containing protein n=1 Tax=Listeria booriae TaxID=1552123 RepID=A0A7X0ZWD2_9LIST|nr:hypothetical protein [Listeria booriae]MBC2283582.1 hypothetical protein [Listeria booriae]MBC2293091.1 hypothetical protein [Listeria booriae]MBC2311749.1 hypothetical protein [Listeria booriae]
MKLFPKIIMNAFIGVGISFTVKFLLQNVFQLNIWTDVGLTDNSLMTYSNMLLNQGMYFWIGLFCGISFVFIYIDFKKEYVRFLLIYVCYLLSINVPYLIGVAFYQIDLAPLWLINIFFTGLMLVLYFSIYFYQKLELKMINQKLTKMNKD